MNKITIAGCGRVGESTAQILAEEELCREILLLDIHDGVPEGVALDIQQSASLLRFDTRVVCAGKPEGAVTAHPVVADKDILDSYKAGVAYMEVVVGVGKTGEKGKARRRNRRQFNR